MFSTQAEPVNGGQRHRVFEDGDRLSFRALFDYLGDSDEFTNWYTGLLAGFPSDAFYWELPPMTTATLEDPAEFVLMKAQGLADIEPDPAPFRSHFEDARDNGIAVFPNLGGDALLVVPCPQTDAGAYPHLAAFLRSGPAAQIRSLWQVTAETLHGTLGPAPLWLSTSGGGVSWLHIRLDSRPKYYTYQPYRGHADAT